MHSAASARKEFFEAHGAYVNTNGGAAFLFQDGAITHNSGSLYDPLIPPPSDPYEAQKLIVTFWTIRANQAERAHHRLYHEMHACLNNALQRGGYPPDEHQLKPLVELTADVQESRRKLKKAQRKLERLIPDSVHEQRKRDAEGEAHRRQSASRFSKLLDALKV